MLPKNGALAPNVALAAASSDASVDMAVTVNVVPLMYPVNTERHSAALFQ